MAARVVCLVANDLVRPDEVLGLTFTRKAAGELSEGLASRLASFAGEMDRAARVEISVNGVVGGLLGGSAEEPSTERFRPSGNVRVDWRGQPGLWSVRGDEARLADAILQVLRNASDSIPERGAITVRTANLLIEELRPEHVAFTPQAVQGRGHAAADDVQHRDRNSGYGIIPAGRLLAELAEQA